ncbi:YD repeat-containing protein, partial [Paenibacillus sp. yr247]|uniref:RHS repeat domain-containing protein n=1 Tax=Paenibacillus sp. yr247 TaxID=1761880 RepID=UPI0008865126
MHRVASEQRPNGITTTYTYNENNWVTKLEHRGEDLHRSYAYTYDKAGNRIAMAEEDGAATTYAYDALDRLVNVTYPFDKDMRIGDQDDDNNNDNNGNNGNGNNSNGNHSDLRLSTLLQSLFPKTVSSSVYNATYNANQLAVTGAVYGRSTTAQYGRDFNLDDWARLKELVEEEDNGHYVRPDYVTNPVKNVQYEYDGVGNRTRMTADGKVTAYAYDGANRLLSAGEVSYLYDTNGNLTEKKGGPAQKVSYSYTGDNLLKGVQVLGGTGVEFEYDAFRRKVSRTETYVDLSGLLGKLTSQGNKNDDDNGNGNGNGNNGNNGNNNGNHGNDYNWNGIKLPDEWKDFFGERTTQYLYDGMDVLKE